MHSSLHVEDMDLRGNSSAHLSLQQVGRPLQQCFAVPQSLRLRTPSRLTLAVWHMPKSKKKKKHADTFQAHYDLAAEST